MIIIKNKIGDTELVIKPVGNLDVTNATEFLDKLSTSLDENIKVLTIDFKEVSFISSFGLRALLEIQKTIKNFGNLKLIHVNSSVMDILTITGFNKIFEIENE